MASDTIDINQSAQALYQNIEVKARRGYSVDTGCSVSINSGTLGQADTIQVASGDIWFGGSPVSVSQQNAQIDTGDGNPRKDVVYLDTNGSVQVSKGTPEATPANQPGASRFQYYEPEPNDLADTDAVVLAEVWVPAGATSINSNDVADRRAFENVRTIRDSSSQTLDNTSQPALDTTIQGVSSNEQEDIQVYVTPDSSHSFDYAYNFNSGREWDNTNSELDLNITVNWDTQPGTDVSVTVYTVVDDL